MRRKIALILLLLLVALAALLVYGRSRRVGQQGEIQHLYIPIAAGSAQFGVQDGFGISIPITPGRIWGTRARWMGLDDSFDPLMQSLKGERVIIGTNTTPVAYRTLAQHTGSPPKPEYYGEYTKFVVGLADTYQPWAIEVWNEPDVPIETPEELQFHFGAWVVTGDFYNAGRMYGDLTATVYPELNKRGVLVVGGALVGAYPSSLEFLRGALETGKMDYVSVHVYLYQGDDFQKIEREVAKIRELTSLPVMVTETAVISGCSDPSCDTPELRKRQAEYVTYLREQSQWLDIIWLWYSTNNNWRNCGLRRYNEMTPAYTVWAAP